MWYVIWTTTGREEQTKRTIEETIPKGYYIKCFVPKKKECRRQNGTWINIEKTLFPGYLFIEAEQIEGIFFCLKKLPQFVKVLKTGEYFSAVSPEEEEFVRKLLQNGESVEVSRGIFTGRNVQITEGPLKGMEGCIRRVDRHKRKAWLRTRMFGRIIDVCVGLEVTERIDGNIAGGDGENGFGSERGQLQGDNGSKSRLSYCFRK